MTIKTLTRIHRIAGILGFFTILTFWTSTLFVEIFFDDSAVVLVKRAIAYGVLPLCIVLACAGGTGMKLSGKSQFPPVLMKKKRTKLIAGAGLVVLVPSALFLNALASAGNLGPTFYLIQGVELLAGAMNIFLLWSNIRDGAELSGRVPNGTFSRN